MGDNNRDFDPETLPTNHMALIDTETESTVVIKLGFPLRTGPNS